VPSFYIPRRTMQQLSEARTEFIAGVRDFVPLIMGIVPFGLICGAAALAAGLTPWQAFSMNWIIFTGSAQIITSQLYGSGAPLLVIIATATIMNLRFMIYATSIGPSLRTLNRKWQVLLAYMMTDQAYALGLMRYMEKGDPRHRHWYLFGVSFAIWLIWQLAGLGGILVGSLIPSGWSMDFILPLTFIAVVVPVITKPAMLHAALAGGIASVALDLPLKLNLIAATGIGILAGVASEKLWNKN